MNDLQGRQLGDYILLRKITSGGMAHIYLGEDQKLGRRAAVKILTPDLAGDDDTLRERFEREARAIGQLEHDSIIPIYQFGEQDNLYFLVMRYIEGNDLADEMKKYRASGQYMPIERALRILKQVASALDHAHQYGIIHRDVKPSNILLGPDDKAVLTDFGLVLWQSVDTTYGTAFGTPRYISPEQATDSQSVVPQSDIYSMAVIVYEIVTGQQVFSGATPMEVALAHITETPTPPRAHNSDVPRNVQIEILKALSKDADKRHSNATEFIRALEQAYGVHIDSQPTRPEGFGVPLEDSKGTMPIAPEDHAEQTAKAAQLNNQWTTGQNTSPTLRDATPAPTTNNLPIVPIAAIVVLVVMGILLALGVFNQRGNDGDVAGGSETPNTIINAPSGETVEVMLQYDRDFLAIINPNPTIQVSIASLGFTAPSGDTTLSTTYAETLQPGECVFIKRGNIPDSSIPTSEVWGQCSNYTSRAQLNPPLFWFANDADDRTFLVRDGNTDVVECVTVGNVMNTAEAQCVIPWSYFSDVEE